MRRIIAPLIAAFAFIAGPANATQSWAPTGSSLLSSTATFTTGTEAMTQPAAYVAATTYAAGNQVVYNGVPWVSLQSSNTGHKPCAACASADGRFADAWWAPVGIPLDGVSGWKLKVCAVGAAATVSTSGSWDVYWWDPITGLWSIETAPTLTLATGKACASTSGESPGLGVPVILRYGWLAVLPRGAAMSDSGSMTATIFSSRG